MQLIRAALKAVDFDHGFQWILPSPGDEPTSTLAVGMFHHGFRWLPGISMTGGDWPFSIKNSHLCIYSIPHFGGVYLYRYTGIHVEGWRIAQIPPNFPRWEGGFAPDPTTLVQTCGCFTARHRFGVRRSGEPHGRQCRLGWDAPLGRAMTVDTGCMEMLWFIVDMFLSPEIQVGLPEVDGYLDIWSIFIIIKIKLVSVDIAIPLIEGDGRFIFGTWSVNQ